MKTRKELSDHCSKGSSILADARVWFHETTFILGELTAENATLKQKVDSITELMLENVVLKQQLEVAINFIEDFKMNGLRADLNPTQPMDDCEKITMFFLCYLRNIDSNVSSRAKEALAKIKEIGSSK